MLLDINDRGLMLTPDGDAPSVGVFAQTDKQNFFGSEALKRLRLNPVHCEDRFWRDLGTQPPGKSLKGVRHNADLAWQHIKAIAGDRVASVDTVALPAHYGREQAALLSGILQNLGSQGCSLINRSLLCLAARPDLDYHLDLQLHQSVLVHVERQGSSLSIADLQEFPRAGLFNLVDMLMRTVQQVFIEKTRFDPLHQAATEQQLFEQLLALLSQPLANRQEIALNLQSGRYQVEITAAQLEQAVTVWLAPLADAAADKILLMDDVLPALTARMQFESMQDQELLQGWRDLRDQLSTVDGFQQVTSLELHSPGSASAKKPLPATLEPDTAVQPAADLQPAITHALLGRDAWPLADLKLFQHEGRLALGVEATRGDLLASFTGGRQPQCLAPDSSLRLNGAPLRQDTPVGPEDLITSDTALGTVHFIRVKGFGNT